MGWVWLGGLGGEVLGAGLYYTLEGRYLGVVCVVNVINSFGVAIAIAIAIVVSSGL